MTRFLPIIATLITVLLVAGGGFFVLKALEPKAEQVDEEPAGLSVFGERIERDDLTFKVTAQGEVRPQREIIVSPQLSGRVSYISPDFIDGGFIRKGQTLMRIEAADFELGVVRAKSGVASAEQRLAREMAEAEIAREDLESLGIMESSPLARREPQLEEARASLASAEAQLADAELALKRTAVISPFTGRVREKAVDVGQFVNPGQNLGQIFASDVVEVVLPLSDAEMGQLGLPLAFAETADNKGPDVIFSTNVAGQPRSWTGRVTRTAATVNPQTRLINVIGVLEDPYGEGADNGVPLAPGLFPNATIEGNVVEDLLIAPRGALRSGNQIYTGDPDTSELRVYPVDVVFTSPEGAWFRSPDITDGDLAVVSPVKAGFDGMSITLLERMPDGTIFTHEPKADKEGSLSSESATASVVSEEGSPR